MPRLLGSKDKEKRNYNLRSGRNGANNFKKIPCYVTTLLTYDTKVKYDGTKYASLEDQVLTENMQYDGGDIVRFVEAAYGTECVSQCHWEVGTKRRTVHFHALCRVLCKSKYDLDKFYAKGHMKRLTDAASMIRPKAYAHVCHRIWLVTSPEQSWDKHGYLQKSGAHRQKSGPSRYISDPVWHRCNPNN